MGVGPDGEPITHGRMTRQGPNGRLRDGRPATPEQERVREAGERQGTFPANARVGPVKVFASEAPDELSSAASVKSSSSMPLREEFPLPQRENVEGALGIAAARNDDPWDKTCSDSLGVNDDAKAFARLAMTKSYRPPLAVGIFGSWGAGKSFFMRLIHEHIERIQAGKPTPEAPEAGAPELNVKVVQIRFNAWHYAETNLWASLVGQIFHDLAKGTSASTGTTVLSRLSTARELTLEAAQELAARARERHAALESYSQAKKDAELLRYRIDPVGAAKAAIATVFNDGSDPAVVKAREDLAAAAKELGLDELAASEKQLTEAGAALLKDGVTAGQQLSTMLRRGSSPAAVMLFLALFAIAVFAVPWGVQWVATYLGLAPTWLRDTIAQVSALLVAGVASVSYVRKPIKAALNRLKQAKSTLDGLAEKRKEGLEAEANARKATVEDADVRLKAAGEHLKSVMERLASVSDELYGQTPGNRLVNFVRARATDGSYAQHLGLISTVRKDFEQLSECLESDGIQSSTSDDHRFRQQVEELIFEAKNDLTDDEKASLRDLAAKQPPKDDGQAIHRIVLYIDDLDRCPPDKVVEVIQAVHMLLAFRLFVVFVAVDVRWLSSSLTQQYGPLLQGETDQNVAASPSDYLEKIFQLPYWVPNMNSDTSTQLLWRTLGLSDKAEEEDDDDFDAPPVGRADGVPVSVHVGELNEAEASLVAPFAQQIQSPRKLLRLVNLLCLFKVNGYLFSDQEVDQSVSEHQHVRALIAQATIATAVPNIFPEWLQLLSNQETEDGPIDDQLKDAPLLSRNEGAVILRVLKVFSARTDPASPFGNGLGQLRHAGRVAQRFSFAQPPARSHESDF